MKTIMAPKFMDRAENIVEEVLLRTCIDDADAEVIEELILNALNEYYDELNEYYEEEYYNEVSRARNASYDDGHSDGYEEGYADGYDKGHSAV